MGARFSCRLVSAVAANNEYFAKKLHPRDGCSDPGPRQCDPVLRPDFPGHPWCSGALMLHLSRAVQPSC
eukprot:263541-Pelagomonas_calceolata.AAC.2